MLNGAVLYRDVFDHKGPFIFFIYALAQSILDLNWGIFLIDVIIFNIAFWLQFKTMQLHNNKMTAILFLFELIFFIRLYRIIIPESIAFMAISYTTYWILSKQYQKPKISQLIICGILTGVVFWIKFSLCVFMFAIYLFFIFKNFSPKHVYYPLMGFLIPTTIVAIYFISNNAMADLFFSYFAINLGYHSSFSPSINFYILVCGTLALFIYSIFKKHAELTAVITAYMSLIIVSFIMTGKNFSNYYLPFMGVISLFPLTQLNGKVISKLKSVIIAFLIIILCVSLLNHSVQIENSARNCMNHVEMFENVEHDDSIMLLYSGETAIIGHLKSYNYKYFFTPSLQYEQHPKMWDKIYCDISNSNIEYLVTICIDNEIKHNVFYDESEKTLEYIQNINQEIYKNYYPHKTYSNYVLWHKKKEGAEISAPSRWFLLICVGIITLP